ncbi:MAG: histidine kinase N-terminal domain-containing protein [Firmicutes bacterium]|nr:histidine kinase N-terminal domain-containing protein [Bacillota bacterium]
MDRDFIKKTFGLSDNEVRIIEEIDRTIGYYSEVTRSDLFLDCFISGKEGMVVSQGQSKKSLYKRNIVGEKVLPKNEPTVFYTMETGVGMSDSYGISQENMVVQQKTSPVIGDNGRVIGVMVQETDVSDKARLNDKLNHMANVTEKLSSSGLVKEGVTDINSETGEGSILLQETHHRIKNNLQTISSILNIQRRRTSNEETKSVLADNISRINSLAAMHEIMMTAATEEIELSDALRKQVELFESIHQGVNQNIRCDYDGVDVMVPFEKAQAISMIVNELMVNAVKHGFRDREEGVIKVRLLEGERQATVMVFNDGEAYRENPKKRKTDTGLGLEIVRGLAEDKLKGTYALESSNMGTTVMISFPI